MAWVACPLSLPPLESMTSMNANDNDLKKIPRTHYVRIEYIVLLRKYIFES